MMKSTYQVVKGTIHQHILLSYNVVEAEVCESTLEILDAQFCRGDWEENRTIEVLRRE